MNDFFHWNLTRIRPFDHRAALTDAQCDELFDLFRDAGLPDTAMNVEMADGYITGCELSPQPVAVHEWMEGIFGQPSLPICADPALQDRLLELLVQRHWDVMTALSVPRDKISADNLFTPLRAAIPEAESIRPYQLDAQEHRLGEWDLKDWTAGFLLAIRQDDEWETLASNPETSSLLAPLMLLQIGYNPDQRDQQIDDDTALIPHLVASLYAIRDHWRAHHRAMIAARATMKTPFVREATKTGRNDPCPCGSGKKYKKCCGAA